ncbi:hypothetical protein ACFL2V_19295 [Pseudomonadota bacterium]
MAINSDMPPRCFLYAIKSIAYKNPHYGMPVIASVMCSDNMKIYIKDFIKIGCFGPVKIGMPKEEVLEYLGEPDSDNDLDETGSILLYARYELFFNHENILWSIQNDNYDPKEPVSFKFENDSVEIDSWFLNQDKGQTIDSVSKLLNEQNVKYSIVEYYGRKVIKAESEVVVDFSDEENETGIHELIGLRYWPGENHT